MFTALTLWANVAIFLGAAAVVWFAGIRITHYAVVIAQKTGIGYAATGVLLLAVVTSLPEAAVTVSASAAGNAGLALNNLLGSVALHLAILAVADAVYSKEALTSVIADPVVLLQAALNILLLALFSAAAVIGDLALPGVGAWSVVLLVAYVAAVWFIRRGGCRDPDRGDPALQVGRSDRRADRARTELRRVCAARCRHLAA